MSDVQEVQSVTFIYRNGARITVHGVPASAVPKIIAVAGKHIAENSLGAIPVEQHGIVSSIGLAAAVQAKMVQAVKPGYGDDSK